MQTELSKYYAGLKFTKTESPSPAYSTYVAKIQSLTRLHRYVFIICPFDSTPLGISKRIDDLAYVSIQTRTLERLIDLPEQKHVSTRGLLESELYLKEERQVNDSTEFIYFGNSSTVTLFSAKRVVKYDKIITVRRALETYYCAMVIQ